jgi:hypothetical protein
MISAFLVFVLLSCITYVFFSVAIANLVFKIDTNNLIPASLKIVFSFGLAPFITTLLLHYLLWIFPFQSAIFYVGIIFTVFSLVFLYSINGFPKFLAFVKEKIIFVYNTNFKSKEIAIINNRFFRVYFNKQGINFENIFIIIIFLIACFYWLLQIIGTPIIGHDMLEYAIQAKHFAREKIVEYIPNRYHTENNFFYVGLHGFSFPLMGTWEYLFSEIFGEYNNDYFLRSVTGYYSFLVFFLQFVLLKRINLFLAVFSSLLLFCTYGFYLTVTAYHIDSYRIFMITSSMVLLAMSIKNNNVLLVVLLGLFAGGQGYIHSLGVFIAVFISISFFVFYPSQIKEKVKFSLLLFLTILLSGGIHYIMDVFFGTGWIFQEIKYY